MRVDPRLVLHAGGVTFCVIAWGYLVMASIDFGASAREGTSEAWLFLAVACLGAACCLFAGLMLGSKMLATLGLTGTHDPAPPTYPGVPGQRPSAYAPGQRSGSRAAPYAGPHDRSAAHPPRVPGGRRAAR